MTPVCVLAPNDIVLTRCDVSSGNTVSNVERQRSVMELMKSISHV